MNSINRRLLVLLLVALTVAALLAGVSTYLKAHEEVSELFDYQLLKIALSLRDEKTFVQRHRAYIEQEDDITIQVWDPTGALIYVSPHNYPLPRATNSGLQTVNFKNDEWRVYFLVDQGRMIQVSQPFKTRRILSFHFALPTIIPLMFIFPALAIAIWIIVLNTLKPLIHIADEVAQRSPASLEPLPENNLPAEILPLVQRLNSLFEQLSRAFNIQKRFVADAAHELRTPLTAIKLQVRVLERCTNGDGRKEAFDSLKSGIDRATRLVGQLLTLVRVEPEVPLMPFAQVSLNGLTKEIIAEQACVATDKDVNLGLNCDGQVLVYGEADALRAMISNLIDNAIHHTLPGGTIDVHVHKNELSAIIEIADTGPGISLEDRERVFDRFYRSKDVSSTGCGLGLAIVKSAVNRHGGTISLGETVEEKGLRVVIELPLHLSVR